VLAELPLIGLLGSSFWELLRGAVVLPTSLALEPVLVLLAVGHGGAFEGQGCRIQPHIGDPLGTAQVGPAQVGIGQVGPLEVGTGKVGIGKVGPVKVGMAQVGMAQVGISQGGIPQTGTSLKVFKETS
jgi:hypothetical protein